MGRSTIPSNSLASVYGLLAECAERKVLGPDVDIEIDACDECNTVVNVKRIIARIRAAGGGFVGAGRRAVEPVPARARHRAASSAPPACRWCIGGFHVGRLHLDAARAAADLKEALDLGVTLFAGEAEGRMDDLLRDVDRGRAASRSTTT